MKVLVLIQEGVYRHCIMAVLQYDSEADLKRAISLAKAFVEAEHDHYHEIAIVEMEVNNEAKDEEVVAEVGYQKEDGYYLRMYFPNETGGVRYSKTPLRD